MPSSTNKEQFFALLQKAGEELDEKIEIIAIGGTAMTLLNLKTSTIDVDIEVSRGSRRKLGQILKQIPHGLNIDPFEFKDGLIFSQQLPDDYREKAILVSGKFKNIRLYALSPLDIVASKLGRLNERDWQDIQACIKKAKLTRKQVKERAEKVEVVGSERIYKDNLERILEELFNSR